MTEKWRENLAVWEKGLSGTEQAAQLAVYRQDETAGKNAFYQDLSFGTAGMRGELGIGSNMMNIYTVRRASCGLAAWLLEAGREKDGVVISYDSRLNSALFARETALTLAAYGVKAYLYDKLTSVPQLSFSVRTLGCAAGVVITASHNPAKYNGYKVYGADGGQISGKEAEQVESHIRAIKDIFAVRTCDEQEAIKSGMLVYVGAKLDEKYYQAVLNLLPASNPVSLQLVYTPLHGTGLLPVTQILGRRGFRLQVVSEQREPDGRFPTVSAPNPENPEAFTLGIALAHETGSRLILATDPDCDRLGAAVAEADGKFTLLSGNQIGCLLLDYLLSQYTRERRLGGFVVRSIVSTPLADAICAANEVETRVVLTGFKYIAEQIRIAEQSGGKEFLFGFEESYGYLAGSYTRDKDAAAAALLLAEAAAAAAVQGRSLLDQMQAIYEKYGWYREQVISFTREGADGIAAIAAVCEQLRSDPPIQFAQQKVVQVIDYLEVGKTGLSPANVLEYRLAAGSVIIRPSGTEPKLKAYVSVSAASDENAAAAHAALLDATRHLIEQLLKSNTGDEK